MPRYSYDKTRESVLAELWPHVEKVLAGSWPLQLAIKAGTRAEALADIVLCQDAEDIKASARILTKNRFRYGFLLTAEGPDDWQVYCHESRVRDWRREMRARRIPYTWDRVETSDYDRDLWQDGMPDTWRTICELQASGIVSERVLAKVCDNLGIFATTDQTMGTIGGPLGIGCVPDISFRAEESYIVSCVRVTPCEVDGQPIKTAREYILAEMLTILRRSEPYDWQRMFN